MNSIQSTIFDIRRCVCVYTGCVHQKKIAMSSNANVFHSCFFSLAVLFFVTKIIRDVFFFGIVLNNTTTTKTTKLDAIWTNWLIYSGVIQNRMKQQQNMQQQQKKTSRILMCFLCAWSTCRACGSKFWMNFFYMYICRCICMLVSYIVCTIYILWWPCTTSKCGIYVPFARLWKKKKKNKNIGKQWKWARAKN